MKTIVKDPELETELQELYIVSNHWLSDIRFEEDEIRILKQVIGRYLDTQKSKLMIGQVKEFNNAIAQQETKTLSLKNKVLELLEYLGPFVDGRGKEVGLDVVQKFGIIEMEVSTLLESIKKLKTLLFSFIDTQMKTDGHQSKPLL